MIVDINAFIGQWPYWPVHATAPAEVVAQMAAWKIDRAAVCSTRGVFVNWEDGNAETESAVRQYPESLLAFACLGTRELSHKLDDRDYDFAAYQRRGFLGVRLYPQHHSYHPLFAGFVDAICEDARARQWPVLLPLRIVMNWAMPSIDLTVIESLVERHPGTIWILSGINYLHELQLAVSLMRRFETVHLETSCIMGYSAIDKLVRQCGEERLLFGSGGPVQHGGAGVAKVANAHIPSSAMDAVLFRNANRLLGQKTCD
jgi:uncharacterized protein